MVRSFSSRKSAAFSAAWRYFVVLEHAVAVGVGGDHQAVPGGQDLVVAQRRGPLLADGQQPARAAARAALPAPRA